MDHLDRQMQAWSTRLRDDLKIGPPESNQLATTIAKEVASLSEEVKQRALPAAGRPDNRVNLTAVGLERDPLEHMHPALTLAEVAMEILTAQCERTRRVGR